MLQKINIATLVLRIALAAALVAFALYWRSPIFASARTLALMAFLLLVAALIGLEIVLWRLTRQSRVAALLSGAALVMATAALTVTLFYEAQFRWLRHQVLKADAQVVERIGRHFIVGYRDFSELRELVERRAVAGIFVTAHNVRGLDAQAIRRDIAFLQEDLKDTAQVQQMQAAAKAN